MATQLFLLDTVADTHLGTDNADSRSSPGNVGWTSRALSTARGSGVVATDNVPTVTTSTFNDEVVVTKGGLAVEWISSPVAADVTISGTITGNAWAAENNMSANVGIAFTIDIIRANTTTTRNSNTLQPIIDATSWSLQAAAEMAVTTRAVNNFNVGGYTAQTVNRGDRIRIRMQGNPISMASGFTFNASYNGATAAADGDTYVTFTENITFEGISSFASPDEAAGTTFGDSAATTEQLAVGFTASGSLLSSYSLYIAKFGAPTDNYVIEVQSDSGGVPSGSVVGTIATIAGTSITTTRTLTTWSPGIALTSGTPYWIVLRRSGSVDGSNFYVVGWTNTTGDVHASLSLYRRVSGSWVVHTSVRDLSGTLVMLAPPAGSILYLTDTASDVATASVDLEAWTSRGGGVVSKTTNSVTGWTAPLQMTYTAGGTVIDWFTKQLTAFTLTGMAVGKLWLQGQSNFSARCEIARVDSDGTNPTVWASWCIAPTGTDNGILPGSPGAIRTANISGDDLVFTNGQRIRIRVYLDDASSQLMPAGGGQGFIYYAGTSAAASGDTYITLPQAVTEFVAGGTSGSSIQTRRQRRASRFLTFR